MAANSSVVIVADQNNRAILSELGKPVVAVQLSGQVISDGQQNVLLVDQVSTQQYRSLSVNAGSNVVNKLRETISKEGKSRVTITGRVLETEATNTLVLDEVCAARSLPIVAGEKAGSQLAKIAGNGANASVNVKAKIQDGVLILDAVEQA